MSYETILEVNNWFLQMENEWLSHGGTKSVFIRVNPMCGEQLHSLHSYQKDLFPQEPILKTISYLDIEPDKYL